MNYFEGLNKGYLILLRVYEIKDVICCNNLDKVRKGRNFYYKLNEPCFTDILKPVIDDKKFQELKNDLIMLLRENYYYRGIM